MMLRTEIEISCDGFCEVTYQSSHKRTKARLKKNKVPKKISRDADLSMLRSNANLALESCQTAAKELAISQDIKFSTLLMKIIEHRERYLLDIVSSFINVDPELVYYELALQVELLKELAKADPTLTYICEAIDGYESSMEEVSTLFNSRFEFEKKKLDDLNDKAVKMYNHEIIRYIRLCPPSINERFNMRYKSKTKKALFKKNSKNKGNGPEKDNSLIRIPFLNRPIDPDIFVMVSFWLGLAFFLTYAKLFILSVIALIVVATLGLFVGPVINDLSMDKEISLPPAYYRKEDRDKQSVKDEAQKVCEKTVSSLRTIIEKEKTWERLEESLSESGLYLC